MNVTEALSARRSIRAFKPDPIPTDTMHAILNAAIRTPSWANSQPWEIYVAQGKTLSNIKSEFLRNYSTGENAGPELSRPTDWPESAKKRQKELYPDMVRDCGDAVKQFGELNNKLFNAPAVIYLCMDKILAHWSVFDLGAFTQSIMLLAVEHGLGTIPAVTLVNYPQVIRNALNIPDNLTVIFGIAIGYVDNDNAINHFCSARSPIEEVVKFFD